MIPKEAQPVFYNKNVKNNTIEKYIISDYFYITFADKYLLGNNSELVFKEIV
jgi:hypothetical protein